MSTATPTLTPQARDASSEQMNWRWGIDFSTKAASIGWVDETGEKRGVKTIAWPKGFAGGERLGLIYASMRADASALCLTVPAVHCYVEQPSGHLNIPELSYACGVIQAAVADALYLYWTTPVEVRTVTSTHWKKSACGNSKIRKPDPKKGEDWVYPVIEWCEARGVRVRDDNEADAVAIAECNRLEVRV